MVQDHNDIYSIVERLRILEEGLTPTTVKHGLNKQQKSVNQLSATFKPKTVAVLTAPTDPKNPMAGKMVGGCEEEINNEIDPAKDRTTIASEAKMSEDVLEKVKRSFTDFIKHVENEIKDSDLKDKKHEDSDIKKKEKQDRDLLPKQNKMGEDSAQGINSIPDGPQETGAVSTTTVTESPIKTIAMEDGSICEIHGNEHNGFEIRHRGRCLPSKFKDIDQAEMALQMFQHHRRKKDESQDYIDEA